MVDPTRQPPAAQLAMRGAIDRALAVHLTATELRVFLAVIKLVALFDRLEDRIANSQIAEATGIDSRHVRRALRRLHDLGVIEREPGKSSAAEGRMASLVRLATGGESCPPSDGERGANPAPGLVERPGADSDRDRGRIPTATGGAYAPASESLSESSSENHATGGESCPRCDDVGTVQVAVEVDGMGKRTEDVACPARCSNVPPWARRAS